MCYQIDYGCEHPAHHAFWGGRHPSRCCCAPGYGPRRFPTKEELISQLEEYLKDLQTEVKGVKEYIAELRKGTA